MEASTRCRGALEKEHARLLGVSMKASGAHSQVLRDEQEFAVWAGGEKLFYVDQCEECGGVRKPPWSVLGKYK